MPNGLSRRPIAIGLLAGLAHAVLALWLRGVVRGRSVPIDTPESPSGVLVLSGTVLGLVLLGGIPVALYVRYRLLAPIVALVVLFAWAFASSWHYFEPARRTGATPIELYADSLFGVLWIVPLAVVLLVGLVEYSIRSRLDDSMAEAGTG